MLVTLAVFVRDTVICCRPKSLAAEFLGKTATVDTPRQIQVGVTRVLAICVTRC